VIEHAVGLNGISVAKLKVREMMDANATLTTNAN
jgi:hypothetical protein